MKLVTLLYTFPECFEVNSNQGLRRIIQRGQLTPCFKPTVTLEDLLPAEKA